MLGKLRKTGRGFDIVDFDDANGRMCSLQQSSAIGDSSDAAELPGTSFVWLGREDARMHLDREQVSGLVERLQLWLDTGSIGHHWEVD